jgi:hypothetical protein
VATVLVAHAKMVAKVAKIRVEVAPNLLVAPAVQTKLKVKLNLNLKSNYLSFP